ncbi:DUF5683 domain-containing protein [Cardinium endosymbiont of Culicoides punctatus]|uniref:DUF5683 domain-containing protein n=1 Tax=Cardinium endosymbiont of Culicoides punctatus TaxID=2304601 RepID=UPI001058AB1F|nr:DUF5683 domain-containing protein [Cardinium endosymbiont of Culicoides punctatus]TDG95157.1 hypothetical protein CCPUN_05750 [Cardinium endosymbiont of Culicoides punctatus]
MTFIGSMLFLDLSIASTSNESLLCTTKRKLLSETQSYAPRLSMLSITTPDKSDEETLQRKTMQMNAMVQRSWISSMVIPGLGQVYNKHYWKVPCIYLGFAMLGYRIHAEHQEMNSHKRTLLVTSSNNDQKKIQTLPLVPYTQKRINDCKRTRNLFIMIAAAWYLLNVFDAYAGAHDKMVNFTDDIGIDPEIKTSSSQPAADAAMVCFSLPVYF